MKLPEILGKMHMPEKNLRALVKHLELFLRYRKVESGLKTQQVKILDQWSSGALDLKRFGDYQKEVGGGVLVPHVHSYSCCICCYYKLEAFTQKYNGPGVFAAVYVFMHVKFHLRAVFGLQPYKPSSKKVGRCVKCK